MFNWRKGDLDWMRVAAGNVSDIIYQCILLDGGIIGLGLMLIDKKIYSRSLCVLKGHLNLMMAYT